MISVIMPTLNEASSVLKSLMALQPLRAQGHEVVLVDAGSTDNTLQVAQPWVDRTVIAERPEQKGRANQMNLGAEKASGSLLLFLHADTVCSSEALKRINILCEQILTRDAIVFEPCWGYFKIKLSGDKAIFRVIERCINLRSGLTQIATGDQGLFMSRQAFDSVNGFPSIALMEDVAISKQLRNLTSAIRCKETIVTSSRRWETCGVFRTILLMWSLRFAFFCHVRPERLAQWYRR